MLHFLVFKSRFYYGIQVLNEHLLLRHCFKPLFLMLIQLTFPAEDYELF